MTHRLAVIGGAALAACSVLSCAGKASEGSSANGGRDFGSGEGGSVNSGGANSTRAGQAGAGIDLRAGGGGQAGQAQSAGGGSAGRAGDELSGGSGGQVAGNAKLLTSSAWDVTVTATWVSPNSHSNLPLFELTLVLFDQTELSGLLSGVGSASEFGLLRQSGDSASIAAKDSGGQFPFPDPQLRSALTVQSLKLDAFDDNSDGVADRLVGVGDGSIEESCGDCTVSNPVKLTLVGQPDHTAPRLGVASEALNPIDSVSMLSSEALKSALVALTGSKSVALDNYNPNAPLIGVGTFEVLPFSGAWQVTGAGWDFAQNALDLSAAKVSTIADPGLFEQDGFEAPVHASLTGEGAIVDASSGLPIPSGQRALLLPPGSSATFHLKRTSSASATVSASFVDLSDELGGVPLVRFQAAVIGSNLRAEDFSVSDPGMLPTNHPIWTKADAARTMRIYLEGSGNDVAVRIRAELCTWGPCPAPGALLVDDLKLE